MKELKTKAMVAVERFLEHRGYSVIESCPELQDGRLTDIVANDGNALVFIEVLAKSDPSTGFPEELNTEHVREAKEMEAIRWLQQQGSRYFDMAIRFDVISILISDPDRALIRHHINAMTESALLPEFPCESMNPFVEEPQLACATA